MRLDDGAQAIAQRPTWCEIDLSAVRTNMTTIRAMVGPGTGVCVCVKGDANGCGDFEVARAAEAAAATCVAFGNLDRALAARAAGLQGPIMLYPCLPAGGGAGAGGGAADADRVDAGGGGAVVAACQRLASVSEAGWRRVSRGCAASRC